MSTEPVSPSNNEPTDSQNPNKDSEITKDEIIPNYDPLSEALPDSVHSSKATTPDPVETPELTQKTSGSNSENQEPNPNLNSGHNSVKDLDPDSTDLPNKETSSQPQNDPLTLDSKQESNENVDVLNPENDNLDMNLLDLPGIDFNTENLDLDFMPQNTDGNMLDLNQNESSKEDIDRERMKLLVSHFDEQQMSRYAAFRRANIRRAAVRKFVSHLLNQPISNNVAVVLAGMSKVLIGDVIELARDIQEKVFKAQGRSMVRSDGEPEPLLPGSIREAWRVYKLEEGTVPGNKARPGSGNRFF